MAGDTEQFGKLQYSKDELNSESIASRQIITDDHYSAAETIKHAQDKMSDRKSDCEYESDFALKGRYSVQDYGDNNDNIKDGSDHCFDSCLRSSRNGVTPRHDNMREEENRKTNSYNQLDLKHDDELNLNLHNNDQQEEYHYKDRFDPFRLEAIPSATSEEESAHVVVVDDDNDNDDVNVHNRDNYDYDNYDHDNYARDYDHHQEQQLRLSPAAAAENVVTSVVVDNNEDSNVLVTREENCHHLEEAEIKSLQDDLNFNRHITNDEPKISSNAENILPYNATDLPKPQTADVGKITTKLQAFNKTIEMTSKQAPAVRCKIEDNELPNKGQVSNLKMLFENNAVKSKDAKTNNYKQDYGVGAEVPRKSINKSVFQ